MIGSISEEPSRAWALTELAGVLGQAGRWSEAERVWQEAEQVIGSISAWGQRGEALARLAEALGQAGRWSEAERMLGSISEKEQQGRALCNLADALAKHNEQERLLSLVHRWWLQAHTRDEAVKLLPLAFGFIPRYPNIGVAFHDAFAWVDDFLRG